MKKWLIGCLMILLFAAPPALAGHNKADGSVCNSVAYIGLREKTETQHRMECRVCHEIMWEDHWKPDGENPTCQKQVRCGLCGNLVLTVRTNSAGRPALQKPSAQCAKKKAKSIPITMI